MFDQMVKPLVLFPFVLDHEIVGISLFKQWCSNDKFALQMLFEKQGSKRFVDTFELCIKGAVIENDLFNDTVAFDIVVGIYKIEVKYFQLSDPCEILIDYHVRIPVSSTRMTC